MSNLIHRLSAKKTYYFILAAFTCIKLITFFKTNAFYNPDEFEWLYCVKRCYSNPVPFIGFDSHTSGPFAVYYLFLIAKLSFGVSLYSIKLALFISQFTTLLLFQFLFKNWKIPTAASILAVLFFLPTRDILAYNTEYVSLPVFTLLLILRNKNQYAFITAILTILLIFIKIQYLPILAVIAIAQIIKDSLKQLIYFFVALLIVVLPLSLFNFQNFAYNFFIKNYLYTKQHTTISYFTALKELFKFATIPALGILLPILLLKFKFKSSIQFKPPIFAVCLFASAIAAIVLPKNNFFHYYILSFVPLIFLLLESVHTNSSITQKFAYSSTLLFALVGSIFVIKSSNVPKWFPNVKLEKNTPIQQQLKHWEQNTAKTDKPIPYDFFLSIQEYIKPNQTILISGWLESQTYYYPLSDRMDFPYRSNHMFYFQSNDPNILKNETLQLMEDLKSCNYPDIIVITSDYPMLKQILQKLLTEKYTMKTTNSNFSIYIKSKP